MEVQKQIKRRSGSLLRFNLDPHSMHYMRSAQKLHEDHQNPISCSVIVRRALRVYWSLLQKVDNSPEAIAAEIIETKRTAKGVL